MDEHRYDDMLYMPHHQSEHHPHMTRYNRAAQFSPFAALTGYDASIAETARYTEQKMELDENSKRFLDEKFQILMNKMDAHEVIAITYFQPDSYKEGGSYETVHGITKKINLASRQLILYADNRISDGKIIDIDQIVELEGEIFKDVENS